jgi:hypothetical protein
MIPLIVHHRIIDPFDITLTACAEEWHQNMNARLAYDFILLFLLFILPLTLMTYCYIRISFSLWFIDSNARASLSSSSITNGARFSNVSDDFPQFDHNEIRRQSSLKNRPYYIHYHKTQENDPKRKQQEEEDEYHVLINSSGIKSSSNQPRRSRTVNEIKPKSSSITTMTTAPVACRRASSLTGRRFGENGFAPNPINPIQQGRQKAIRYRRSTSPYTSGILRTSLTSLQSQNRVLNSTNGNNPPLHHHHRSIVDVERASRFLQSRRRVVKLLITLGKIYFILFFKRNFFFEVIVFFLTRLPLNIVSIYIDITSNTYLPENAFTNRTKPETMEDAAAVYSSHVTNSDKKMTLVLYVNPILQLFSLSNSAINPLCYCVMSHAVKNLITLVRKKFRRRGQKTASPLPLNQRPVAPHQSIKMILQNRNSLGNN